MLGVLGVLVLMANGVMVLVAVVVEEEVFLWFVLVLVVVMFVVCVRGVVFSYGLMIVGRIGVIVFGWMC